ncbi:uncharacterized protein LOC127744218 [Arachis duranensis]|uniref:Uncharacterized protein LOC127744218 n=1 Tax=Arachis duranensis TaxID=130453 RepID=A0A9C6TE84_ARADU|nr:uncharacterized protein LOC127744218 [Arachis duranensis]
MNIISWNCRGVGSKTFPSLIRDLRHEYSANLFFLLETHVNGIRGNQIRHKIGFDQSFVVDATGHAGGIWCLWDSSVWKVDVLEHDKQFVHLKITGWPYTWKRANLAERLDRGLSNLDWQIQFPEAIIKHMPMLKSDHSPICLQLFPTFSQNRRRRPFRFLAAWISHPDFGNVVNTSWNIQGSWTEGISNFKSRITDWNRSVFGNIFQRKQKILRRLQGINLSLGQSPNSFLEKLQKDLWGEYEQTLNQEEMLWFQKSRNKWIEFGDRNTKFFHGSTMIRRRKNIIVSLQNDTGEWINDKPTLENMATSFFNNLYTDSSPHTPFFLQNMFPNLNNTESHALGRNVSNEEIKDAMFDIGSWKALGRDGLQAIFYQSQWSKIGNDVCNLTKSIFLQPKKVKEVNETLITLISKVEPVSHFKQLRPISLCNVSYKVVTKILANRLRSVMNKLVRPNQCSFIPGRQSADNIIITQEVIHSMRNKKGGKGWMAIKIDLEKAYDRLKWSFIKETLLDIGLPKNFIDLTLSCISTARMRVLWNGEELEEFSPTRGIRQGDPISPYIFVLCIERLSQLISIAVDQDVWKPICLKKDGPPISHLCFADDIILFAEAKVDQANIINKCLEAFCQSSGQNVSKEKTRIFFSKNVGHMVRTEISNVLQFARTDDLGKYLGVPVLHSKVTKHTFEGIINKLHARLNSSKASSLSLAGRTTLVKSVLSSMPLYNMQSAILPASTCNTIDRICRNFIWGDTDQNKKIHLLNWKMICEPKHTGGLGIRHASLGNKAFMMKAGWGLIAKKDDLWAKVLRSKYGCGNDTMPRVERKRSNSNIWRGICASWENVERNCIWRVGDGTRIRFWDHHWAPGAGRLSDSLSQVSSGFNSTELLMDFCDISGHWDVGKLQGMLPEDIVQRITAISPPSPWKEADHIAWEPSSDGIFSTKTAYQVIMEEQHTQNQNFRLVWRWQGPERIRTFLWLATHNVILTNSERKRRHLTNDDSCPRCRCHEESTIHVLRDCFYAKSIWRKLFPPIGINSFFNTDLNEWLLQNLKSNNKWSCLFGVAVSTMWYLRNKLVFNGESVLVTTAVNQIRARSEEFGRVVQTNLTLRNNHNSGASNIRWSRPEKGYIKVNVDGSWFSHKNNAACGGVFRDANGKFMSRFAVIHGLNIATTNGYHNLVVESDSAAAINFINRGCPPTHPGAPLVQDIRILAGTNILQNIMYGTRLLINPDVPEAVMLRKNVYYREISQYLSVFSGKPAYVNADEVLYSIERKTIKELRVAADVGFYIILATVLDVEHVLSWWYKSCVCSVKAEANADTYFCDNCNKDVNNVINSETSNVNDIVERAISQVHVFEMDGGEHVISLCSKSDLC